MGYEPTSDIIEFREAGIFPVNRCSCLVRVRKNMVKYVAGDEP
jgi:hypothetical protein